MWGSSIHRLQPLKYSFCLLNITTMEKGKKKRERKKTSVKTLISADRCTQTHLYLHHVRLWGNTCSGMHDGRGRRAWVRACVCGLKHQPSLPSSWSPASSSISACKQSGSMQTFTRSLEFCMNSCTNRAGPGRTGPDRTGPTAVPAVMTDRPATTNRTELLFLPLLVRLQTAQPQQHNSNPRIRSQLVPFNMCPLNGSADGEELRKRMRRMRMMMMCCFLSPAGTPALRREEDEGWR